jgi:hypothetical protein
MFSHFVGKTFVRRVSRRSVFAAQGCAVRPLRPTPAGPPPINIHSGYCRPSSRFNPLRHRRGEFLRAALPAQIRGAHAARGHHGLQRRHDAFSTGRFTQMFQH